MVSRFRLSPRLQAILVLGLVAAVGALLGILGDRLVAQQRDARTVITGRPGPGPMSGMPGMGAVRYGDRLALRLDLTADQRVRIDSILAQEQIRIRELSRQFQPQFRAIAEQTRGRVEAVLTDEQRERLRDMREERMRRLGADRPMFRDAVRPRQRRP
jgi:Spy/CpxP family protein refolding chaperone